MLELPKLIDGRYRLDRHVGRGGFGDVYAGVHLALGAAVAVKVLDLTRHEDPTRRTELAARFLEEGRVLTRLRHVNIVGALDLGLVPGGDEASSSPYLVMEWVDGETLQEALAKRTTALALEEAWSLLETLLVALAYAHATGVVHRDLKPANIMIVPTSSQASAAHDDDASSAMGTPRIIDFGVAKLVTPEEDPGSGFTDTAHPMSAFTPAYAAPEQIAQARTGAWTDVHALGLLFVELVTGVTPYGSGTNARLAAIDPDRPTPSSRGIDVGPLEPVIARAISLRPRDRFAHAAEMLEAARAAMRDFRPSPNSERPPLIARPAKPAVVNRSIGSAATNAESAPIAMLQHTEPTEMPVSAAERIAPARTAERTVERSRRVLVARGVLAAVVVCGLVGTAWSLSRSRARSSPPSASSTSAITALAAPTILHVGGVDWQVQNGRWRVEDDALVGSLGQVFTTATFTGATFDVDFEDLATRKTRNTVGFGFRALVADDPNDGSGYGANFHVAEGTYNIFAGTNGDWVPTDPRNVGFHAAPSIVPEGKNHLRIRSAGDAFTVELNGVPLDRFTDATYPSGRFTLWVQSRTQTVRFSGLHLRTE